MINVDDRLIKEDLELIGGDALVVLLIITTHIDKNNKAFPSIQRIQKMAKYSKARVQNALKVLIKHDYIERSQNNQKGVFGKVIYTIKTDYLSIFLGVKGEELESNEIVNRSANNRGTENRTTDNRDTDNRDTEKQPLSINEDLSINELLSIKEVLSIKEAFSLFSNQSENELIESWEEYKDMKKKSHRFKFANDKSELRKLKQLFELSDGDSVKAIAGLENAIDENWKCFKWHFQNNNGQRNNNSATTKESNLTATTWEQSENNDYKDFMKWYSKAPELMHLAPTESDYEKLASGKVDCKYLDAKHRGFNVKEIFKAVERLMGGNGGINYIQKTKYKTLLELIITNVTHHYDNLNQTQKAS